MLILALVTDLFFVSRIQEAAKSFGVEVEWLTAAETDAEFVARLERTQPALIILDLNTSLPWPHWIPAAKGKYVTKRIPWLAFGAHVNVRRLRAARHIGADKVVPKSEFDSELRSQLKHLTEQTK